MQGNSDVIQVLNKVLTGELTAINQYFLHASMCKNWGYMKIADKVEKESIDEMKHAKVLVDRILFLEGVPNLQRLGKLNIGETVLEQYQADLKLEQDAVTLLREGVKLCMETGDYVSQELLEKILTDEENHIDWIETQLELISQIGKENYLAEQMG